MWKYNFLNTILENDNDKIKSVIKKTFYIKKEKLGLF